MKTGTILDADLGTIWAMLKGGARWWVNELSAMVPIAFRPSAKPLSGMIAHYGADGQFRSPGGAIIDETGQATVLLEPAQCLVRQVALPAMPLADLRKLVALDLDRLMPFAAGMAYADVRQSGTATDIAAVPKDVVQSAYTAAVEQGLEPRALGLLDDSGERLSFDFLPSLAAEGFAPTTRSGAPFWWAVVVLLFALNIGILILRDVQSVSRVASLVAAQTPAALAARRIATALARENGVRAEVVALRSRDDALATLAAVTRAVPAGAWVQRYSAIGDTVRIAGYKQADVDVRSALKASRQFAAVRASTSDVAAEAGTGQPFDLTAQRTKAVRR